jgi:molybdopterin molybdotransferase
MNSILPFTEARHLVEEQARSIRPRATEAVSLADATGRVLAEPIAADRDFPPFPRSTRDGYAVRGADVAALPARLRVIGEIRAGAPPIAIGPGECVEIMTGAPVPPGADAVVMVELVHPLGKRIIEIPERVVAGDNLVPRGTEARAGDELLARGTRLNHQAIALAASAGRSRLQVFVRPTVAVLATGDELVDVSATPGPTQIRNSNSYSVAAQVNTCGGSALMLPVARDDENELGRLIERGLADADLLLLTGGVSMGKYDLVEPVLAKFGAEFFFTGARIQPGKPIVFGRCRPAGQGGNSGPCRFFFALPGNPISTMVTFDLFARPLLEALAGMTPRPLLFLQARLKGQFRTKAGLTRFLPARLTGEFERCEVEPVQWQGSGDLRAAARANAYLVVPPDCEQITPGELVSVLPHAW